MKICHEVGGAVCVDAIAELRTILDGEALAPTDASYANALDRWETKVDRRLRVVTSTEADVEIVDVGQPGQVPAVSGYRGYRQPPVLKLSDTLPAKRSEPLDLKSEVEQLVAAGQLELAVERLFVAILSAGLAIALADASPAPLRIVEPVVENVSKLTRREREVAALIASGQTNRAIAYELFIAQSTVERHVANILNKLGFHSRTQIAAWTVTHGLATA